MCNVSMQIFQMLLKTSRGGKSQKWQKCPPFANSRICRKTANHNRKIKNKQESLKNTQKQKKTMNFFKNQSHREIRIWYFHKCPFFGAFMQDVLHGVFPHPRSCKTIKSCMAAMMGPPPGMQEQGGANTKMPDWGLKLIVLGQRVLWLPKFSIVPGKHGTFIINAIFQINNAPN